MTSLVEASLDVATRLTEIAQREGYIPHIVGVHSIELVGDATASIYLAIDDPDLDCGMGCEGFIIVLVDERAIMGMDRGDILQAFRAVMDTPFTEFVSAATCPLARVVGADQAIDLHRQSR